MPIAYWIAYAVVIGGTFLFAAWVIYDAVKGFLQWLDDYNGDN